jgi:hypothetical protein
LSAPAMTPPHRPNQSFVRTFEPPTAVAAWKPTQSRQTAYSTLYSANALTRRSHPQARALRLPEMAATSN